MSAAYLGLRYLKTLNEHLDKISRNIFWDQAGVREMSTRYRSEIGLLRKLEGLKVRRLEVYEVYWWAVHLQMLHKVAFGQV